MLNEDSDSLICDLAETYHVFDMRSLPVRTVAVFASGLSDDSRIKRRLSGQKLSLKEWLLAGILDGLNLLLWTRSAEGTEKPKSILDTLLGNGELGQSGDYGFDSPEDFEKRRKELIEGGGVNG